MCDVVYIYTVCSYYFITVCMCVLYCFQTYCQLEKMHVFILIISESLGCLSNGMQFLP